MKTIGLKDLKIKEVVEEVVVKETKRKPLFLGMKEKDIYKIEYFDGYIYGYNKDGLQTYYEDSDKYWWKREYENGLETYYKNSDKYWWKREYKDGLQTYYEDSDKYWWKREYKDGLETYYKNSDKNWWKKEDGKLIKYIDGKYYIDGEEAELR